MDRNGHMTVLHRTLLGAELRATVTRLDEGIHVLLTGGSKSHIGAISTAEPGERAETSVFPGHKDQFISAPWAEKVANQTGERACVVCGIHYDDATREQIVEIVETADDMLTELLQTL